MKSIQAATYSISFQDKGYSELSNLIESNEYSSLFILVDENTLEHCYPKFIENLEATKSIEIIKIRSGEIHKNLETCISVWNSITKLGGDRKSLLITLGGGVITDLGGFVASCFKRGIDFVNIPTTLLSMVDASVGGKTGVDLGVLKNQIGLFANPEMVLIDTDYLTTVTDREIKSGIAEIIKYGLTYDVKLFNKIKQDKNNNINDLIYKSIDIKNKVVQQDPKEQNIRKILNFGHTLGHAIEKNSGYKLRHGEAVSIGMVFAAELSRQLAGLSDDAVLLHRELLRNFDLPISYPSNKFKPLLALLASDKKVKNSKLRFIGISKIGKPVWFDDVSPGTLSKVYERIAK